MIIFTQGDDNFTIQNMFAQDGNGNPVSLTGAVFETRLLGMANTVVIPNSAHTADPDQVTNKGKFTITLTAAQTQACKPGDTKDIITKVVQSGVTIYYHGKGLLQVLPHDPQQ